MPRHFSIQVQVRYAECDMQGHVFNGHYLTWFDMAHTGLMADALGRPWTETVQSGIDVVVIESGVRYRAPARFEDELSVAVSLDPLTSSSMTSRYVISRSGALIADGFLRHVCVSTGSVEKRAWPEQVRHALEAYVSTPQAEPAEAGEETATR